MKTPYKMYGKSPMMKALIGNQDKLPVELQKKILDSPIDMYGKSPAKTKLGRWLMGRKKHETSEGTVITDKRGNVVKTKSADGTKTKYKKGNRPSSNAGASHDPHSAYRTAEEMREKRKNRGY